MRKKLGVICRNTWTWDYFRLPSRSW